MLNDKQILIDIHSLPPEKQAEILDFIALTKARNQNMVVTKTSPLGAMPGLLIYMSDDFDEPLDDFAEYME